MILKKLSKNFAPLQEGILFGIESESDTPSDIVVEIIEVKSEKVVATQLLRNTLSATVNIAPYLVHFGDYAPTLGNHTTFAEAPTATYKIRVGEIESEEIVISVNRCQIGSTPTMATTLPLARRIAYGESDEVLIVADEGERIYAELENNNGESIHLEYSPTAQATLLTISPNAFDTITTSFEVKLYCGGRSLGELRYKVATPLKSATRLAWISESGAIERYTFPKSNKTAFSTEKKRVLTAEGICTTSCRTQQIVSLSSRIEPCAMVEALAQIASSPKVWLMQEDSCELVDVVTSQIEYNLFGEASYLYLELATSQKEVAL